MRVLFIGSTGIISSACTELAAERGIEHFVPDFAATIPFSRGAEEIIAWYDADPSRRVIDEDLDRSLTRIIADWQRAFST